MEAKTVRGAVQLMVIADSEDTEWLSRQLKGFLHANRLDVIDCTTDYPAREDPTRRKFHILAIPKPRERVHERQE